MATISNRPRTLSISSRENLERGKIVVEVADSGPGIAGLDRERVFENFSKSAGVGLGLPISRSII